MTSGLREFVLFGSAGDEPRSAHDLLATVLSALSPSFTATEERTVRGPRTVGSSAPGSSAPGSSAPGSSAVASGSRRRTWLDTFDWRLWRAGLVLAYEHGRPAGRLLLSAADGTPQAQQPVPGWPRRPCLAADLPAGPVRDRIDALISPRALLPVARTDSHVRIFRLLNADAKTVARLIADRSTVTSVPSLSAPGGGAAELPVRLVVAEVRGYPAAARRAATLLAAVPGVLPAARPVFTEALTALGRHPPGGPCGPGSGGPGAEITAGLPAPVAVARLLLSLLATAEVNVGGVLRDVDTEFLHDLRVAVRRTRSAVQLLGAVLPAELARHYAAEFKWLGDLTTPVRDLDVHLLGLDAMAGQLRAASAADLEPLRAFLARRRRREFRRLSAGLRGPRFRAVVDDWRKALLALQDSGGPPEDRQQGTGQQGTGQPGAGRRAGPPLTAAALAAATTARAFRRVAARGAAITPDSAPESLHDLRKRAKELRYLLEFFAPLYDPAAYRKVVGDLKALQDCLGEFQDSQVQREEIRALAEAMLADAARGTGAVPAATLLAMGEVSARLAASQAEARADFGRRFARFAGPAGRDRVYALLESAAGTGR